MKYTAATALMHMPKKILQSSIAWMSPSPRKPGVWRASGFRSPPRSNRRRSPRRAGRVSAAASSSPRGWSRRLLPAEDSRHGSLQPAREPSRTGSGTGREALEDLLRARRVSMNRTGSPRRSGSEGRRVPSQCRCVADSAPVPPDMLFARRRPRPARDGRGGVWLRWPIRRGRGASGWGEDGAASGHRVHRARAERRRDASARAAEKSRAADYAIGDSRRAAGGGARAAGAKKSTACRGLPAPGHAATSQSRRSKPATRSPGKARALACAAIDAIRACARRCSPRRSLRQAKALAGYDVRRGPPASCRRSRADPRFEWGTGGVVAELGEPLASFWR